MRRGNRQMMAKNMAIMKNGGRLRSNIYLMIHGVLVVKFIEFILYIMLLF